MTITPWNSSESRACNTPKVGAVYSLCISHADSDSFWVVRRDRAVYRARVDHERVVITEPSKSSAIEERVDRDSVNVWRRIYLNPAPMGDAWL